MIRPTIPAAVLGTRRTEIIPYIRKIDLMSSNSYILSGEDQIALIDPGALDDQWDLLVDQMLDLIEERERPVAIYLTHIHLDHCFQLRRCREDRGLGRIVVAVQERGAEALEAQDGRMTLAGLLGRDLFPFHIDVRLLSNEDILSRGMKRLELEGTPFSYTTTATKMTCGQEMISQQVSLGGGDLLEIYPLPGHSPDSICLRSGSILFLGDLFFAPNPSLLTNAALSLKSDGNLYIADAGGSSTWANKIIKWLIKAAAFLYFIIAENYSRAVAESSAIGNIHTAREWEDLVKSNGFVEVKIHQMRSKHFWAPDPIIIKAKKKPKERQ